MSEIYMNREQAEHCDKLIDFMLNEKNSHEIIDVNKAKDALRTDNSDYAFSIMNLLASHEEIVKTRYYKDDYGLMLLPNEPEIIKFKNSGGFVALYDKTLLAIERAESKEQLEVEKRNLEIKMLKKQLRTHWLTTWGAILIALISLIWQIIDKLL